MALETLPWDSVRWLATPKRQQGYLEAALADPEGDTKYILAIIRDIARARGMTEIARLAGVSEKEMFESFIKGGEPSPATLEKVVAALGATLRRWPSSTSAVDRDR